MQEHCHPASKTKNKLNSWNLLSAIQTATGNQAIEHEQGPGAKESWKMGQQKRHHHRGEQESFEGGESPEQDEDTIYGRQERDASDNGRLGDIAGFTQTNQEMNCIEQ